MNISSEQRDYFFHSPFDYHNDEFGFTFIFKRKKISVQNDGINDRINELDANIYALLSKNAYMTIPEIAAEVCKSESTVIRHLKVLIESNRIQRVGSKKNGYWKIIE